jgi:hypothetical protein
MNIKPTFMCFDIIQPITAITEGIDGVEKIYDLRTFSNAKSAASIREVRQTADQVYGKCQIRSPYFLP